MIPKEVLEVFDVLCSPDKPLVWVATTRGHEPHLVPVCFVKFLDDRRLLIGNVFIKKTEDNIKTNPNVAVGVAFKHEGWDGYMLKGKAEIIRNGELFEGFKKEVLDRSRGKREIVSAIVIEIDSVYSLMPSKGKKRLV
jgi:predicted pyridoxine 5'-phosphate oxidase superfamily flavin-nucleotide-binding protein